MIKAIIFDCFGVLTNDTWREFCDTVSDKKALRQARELNHLYDSGKLNFREFIDDVARITDGDRLILEKIFTHPDHKKNYLLLDYIKKLRPKYKIGLLSNVNRDWIREEFLTSEEQNLFDSYTFSYEVGATKPHLIMYQTALERLGVKAQDAVFIDDVESYCQAARDFGMKAIRYENFKQMKTDLERLIMPVSNN